MKLSIRAPKAPEAKTEGRLVALPVKLCEPHPDLQTRLKYDQVDRLAEDIRAHGQLQPGRAVEKPDGTGYLAYIGIGRLLAVKKLFEEHGEPRSYYALLDEGLSFVELFSRSMSENLKRRNLSVLEEVRSYYLASLKAGESEIVQASAEIGEDPASVRKKMELAKVIGERLRGLYEIEGKEGFSFQLGHLEAFGKIDDEQEFYLTAAATAFARFKVHELQASLRNRSIERVALGLPDWFKELFPKYADKKKDEGGAGSAGSGTGSSPGMEETVAQHTVMAPTPDAFLAPETSRESAVPQMPATSDASGSSVVRQPPSGVAYKEGLNFVSCPYCGAYTPFEFGDDSELTVIRFEGPAVPKKDTVAPEGSFRAIRSCVNPECGEEFWLWVAEVDGEPRAEAKKKGGEAGWFSVPSERPMVGSISWSDKKQSWTVKEKGSGGVYLYTQTGMLVEAGGDGI